MEHYDKSIDNKLIQNVEEAKAAFSLPRDLVKYKDLFKMMLNSTSFKQHDIQKENEKIRLEDIINFQDFQKAQMSSEKEELIIETYLIHQIKLRKIASRFRVCKSKINKIVEEVKWQVIKINANRLNLSRKSQLKDIDIWISIKDYWKQRSRTNYIIQNVRTHLKTYSHLSKFSHVSLSKYLCEMSWSSAIKESHGEHWKFKQINFDKMSLSTFIFIKACLDENTSLSIY